MKESSYFCLLALFLVLAICGFGQARVDDICMVFPEGTVIRDPDSCSRSIKCVNSKSTYSTCTGSTPYFDKDTLKCVKTLNGTDDCGVSCVNRASQFISDPKSCFGYYFCADEETPLYGKCGDNQHFDNGTQMCIWTYASDCKAHEFDYCSIIKNGVNFDNAQGCDRYHVCTKGVLEDKTCKKGYYEASSGSCIDKNLVYCDAHPYPSNVCGTVKKPLKNVYVADGATCQGYFFCAQQLDGTPDPKPVWGKCGNDLFFDKSTQTCRPPNNVACTEDRCQGRTIPFVLSSTKGCRHYLRCKDGRTIDEKSCGNYFFDEENAICVAEILKYEACK
ncbi:hypothetical protein ACLKA6_000320 [Drosophila palustris]